MKLVPAIFGLRYTVALGLVLWCAGAGCLAHGMAMGGVLGSSSKSNNLKQAEMAMNGHSCCKARHRALRNGGTAKSESDDHARTVTLPEESVPDSANSCCPLTSGTFVTASRSQTDNDNNSSVLTAASAHEQTFATQFSADSAVPQRRPNHNQIFLTGCAFLI